MNKQNRELKKAGLCMAAGMIAAMILYLGSGTVLVDGNRILRPDRGADLVTITVQGEGRRAEKIDLYLSAEQKKEETGAPESDIEEPDSGSWRDEIEMQLQEEEKAQRQKEYLELPEEIDGIRLSYSAQKDLSQAAGCLLLGTAAAAAIYFLPDIKRKKKEKERRKLLAEDYSQLVTSLCLWLTAGLSLRSAWFRMADEYRCSQKEGGAPRPAYEEMETARKEIFGGVYEDQAYGNFGLRCGTAEYLRLGGMLASYVRQGNKELRFMLETERYSSLNVQLQQIRRRGEEAALKLLLPLMGLFLAAIIIVIAPAWLQMGNM